VRIDGELMEIWPNEVCDRKKNSIKKLKQIKRKSGRWSHRNSISSLNYVRKQNQREFQ